MPLYNWRITFEGGGVEAPNEETIKKTLSNQSMVSANVTGSLKNIRIEVEQTSGIVTAPSGAIPDIRNH